MALSIPKQENTLKGEAQQLLALLNESEEISISSATHTAQVSTELSHLFADLLQKLATGQRVEMQTVTQDLTTTEAARRLGVSRPTLVKLIKTGDLPAHKVGSHYRIDIADLQTYIEIRYQKKVRQIQNLWDFEKDHALEEIL